ncbi:DUF1707 SHOCT-like domain-containing protein [Actinoplanes auranticolor]|uniref:DUF1707 domain-containing protein n=1 Tax=Actinoplanes auranticolor TaxID=47988 RepID=A0A919SEG0_9ACTN|nr:DUF1707 domain-containing protein [Actinoplanes auranticolor]GIM70897.1 hypothetical protein Aau02nite_43180 [Actinoplanes auranticolor]
MTGPDGGDPSGDASAPDLLVGAPERDSAQEVLEGHLIEKRLEPAEYERRVESAKQARTQSELLLLFADLPPPHPVLPTATVPPAAPDDETPPPIFLAGCLMLALGLPVAVVLGFAYGIWWTLAVPVAATVAMAYVEHLRTASRERASGSTPQSPE